MTGNFIDGDPRAIERGRKGGAESARRRKEKSLAEWAAKYPGVDPEVSSKIYRDGYVSGHQAQRQAQKRREKE